MQTHTFGFMSNRHKPGIYLMYPIQLVTINISLCVPCFGFLRLVVKSVEDKNMQKNCEYLTVRKDKCLFYVNLLGGF